VQMSGRSSACTKAAQPRAGAYRVGSANPS
jgi:hypothetical protein